MTLPDRLKAAIAELERANCLSVPYPEWKAAQDAYRDLTKPAMILQLLADKGEKP